MRKSDIVTLLSFVYLLAAVVFLLFFWRVPGAAAGTEVGGVSARNGVILVLPAETGTAVSHPVSASMEGALFIGDLRTVGLQEYAGMDGADFFANAGMSVYNIHKTPVSVPSVGKVTLGELLDYKKYGKIYIMLGISEVGCPLDSTVAEYGELIDFIRRREPEARLVLQANLHVTKSRSDNDAVVNNAAIDRLNAALAELAKAKRAYWLDANTVFDDETGNLSAGRSEDDTHLYAKYYAEWGRWIASQTASLPEEGRS